MKPKLGVALIAVGVGLEVITLISKQGVISSNSDFANTQAQLVNFNEMLGGIHVSYLMIGGGVLLRYVL